MCILYMPTFPYTSATSAILFVDPLAFSLFICTLQTHGTCKPLFRQAIQKCACQAITCATTESSCFDSFAGKADSDTTMVRFRLTSLDLSNMHGVIERCAGLPARRRLLQSL